MATADESDQGEAGEPREVGRPPSSGRQRTVMLGVLSGLVVCAVGVAVVSRVHNSTHSARGVQSTPSTSPIGARFPIRPGTTHPRATTTPTVRPTTTTAVTPTTQGDVVAAPPDTFSPETTPDTNPPATEPTSTPTTLLLPAVTATLPPPPPPYGPDRLSWTAPQSMTIHSGHTAPLSVQAHNATDRSVALSHPLACTPRLDGDDFCSDTVQLIGSGQSASAHFTIDARGIAAGHYTLMIEGVLTVNVTVS
jgi:hypothetical protein